jgi:zona occludens toxin
MPITAYTGLMGSGKSYECVSSVIIPAIRKGRRVVTNVDGIDSDAIRAYCQEQYDSDIDTLGHVVHCHNDGVQAANFLPHGKDVDTFCKAGDLICIDEAWRFWGTDCKLLPEHKIFFREHRHYVDQLSKVSCDLVLMVQDIGDLHRLLKVVVELSFKTTKIKTLGWSKTYRVEMWEGYKQTIRSRVAVQNKRYDKEIFPLYSSYVGGKGKELQVDDRQNVLKNPKIWIAAAAMVVGGYFAVSYIIGFFNGDRFNGVAANSAASTGTSSNTTAVAPAGASSAAQAFKPAIPPVSLNWRIAGTMRSGDQYFVLVANPAGALRLEHPSAFQNTGMAMVGQVDDSRVMVWSGVPAPSVMPGVVK